MSPRGVARAGAVVGSISIALASLVAAVAYSGVDGEAFRPTTHWVSELGEMGVSQLAPVFNVGLVIGGLGFAVFMAGLALTGRGAPRLGYGPIGVAAGIAGALVGIFPMNERGTHGLVAALFFNLGWIAVALASIPIATARDARFPRWIALVGAVTVVAFVAFLVAIRVDPLVVGASATTPATRPSFWITPALEWVVIGAIVGWSFLAAVTWRPAEPPLPLAEARA